MKALEFIKSNLRETLLKGVGETLTSLKDLLPKHSVKFQSLILLESQLNDLKRQTMQGTISEERAQLAKNRIRASLMELINSIDPQDLEEQAEKQSAQVKPSKNTATASPPPGKKLINWRAELVSNASLDRLAFVIYANENEHSVELLLVNTSTTQLYVDRDLVFEESLNVLNTISGIFNLLLTNRETIPFEIEEGGRRYPASISYGVSVKMNNYIKIQLKINDKIIYSSAE